MSPAPSDLAADEQKRLVSRFGRRFAAGDVLFNDGDPASLAFLLQEGRVRLLKRVGSVERSLRLLRPGDLFGESALLTSAPRNSTAVALTEGFALALDQVTFQQVLTSHPEVGTRVLHQLIRRLRDAEDQIEILMLRDSQAKVVVALMKLAQLAGSPDQAGVIVVSISPLELATRVGLDVDTVKRTVKQLRDSGYLQIIEEKLHVSNLAALRELYSLLTVKDQIVGDGRELGKHATPGSEAT